MATIEDRRRESLDLDLDLDLETSGPEHREPAHDRSEAGPGKGERMLDVLLRQPPSSSVRREEGGLGASEAEAGSAESAPQ